MRFMRTVEAMAAARPLAVSTTPPRPTASRRSPPCDACGQPAPRSPRSWRCRPRRSRRCCRIGLGNLSRLGRPMQPSTAHRRIQPERAAALFERYNFSRRHLRPRSPAADRSAAGSEPEQHERPALVDRLLLQAGELPCATFRDHRDHVVLVLGAVVEGETLFPGDTEGVYRSFHGVGASGFRRRFGLGFECARAAGLRAQSLSGLFKLSDQGCGQRGALRLPIAVGAGLQAFFDDLRCRFPFRRARFLANRRKRPVFALPDEFLTRFGAGPARRIALRGGSPVRVGVGVRRGARPIPTAREDSGHSRGHKQRRSSSPDSHTHQGNLTN
jgi:hypothetical protein